MYTSLIWRWSMAHGVRPEINPWLLIVPSLFEAFGWAAAFKTVDAVYDHREWLGYGAAAIVLIVGGAIWFVLWARLTEIWPWRRLRVAKEELAKTLEENSELRRSLTAIQNLPPALRSLAQSIAIKPPHNVQCVGFKVFSDALVEATLVFKNVPNGKLLGKFQWPRLRVTYYDHVTGQELTEMVPLVWTGPRIGSGYAPDEINADESYAQIAACIPGQNQGWTTCAINEGELDDFGRPREDLHAEELPARELRIVAVLSGEHGRLSIPPITGVLTLGEDGSASFVRNLDV